MHKVNLFYRGDPISPSGIGENQTLTAVITQTFSMPLVAMAKLWLAGNGSSSVLVISARLIQGSKNIPVTVNGREEFYVPATGRWSDVVSIADLSLPGDVTLSVSYPEAVYAPTFGDNTDPDEPVAISSLLYFDSWEITIYGKGTVAEDEGVVCLDTGEPPGVIMASTGGLDDSLPISFRMKLNDSLSPYLYIAVSDRTYQALIEFIGEDVYAVSLHQGQPPEDYDSADVGYTTTTIIGASISSDWDKWTIVPVTRNYTGHYIDVSSLDDWRVIVGAEKISVSGGLLLNSDTYGYAYAVTDVAYPSVVDIEIEIDLIEQHVDVNGHRTNFIIDLFGIEIQFYYNEVIIYEYFGGSSMLSYSHVASLSGKHTIKVCRDDTAIKFYVDGSLIYTTTQMYFKNNRITLGSYAIEGLYANVTRIESIRITNPDNLWDDSVKIFKGSEILGIYPTSNVPSVSTTKMLGLTVAGYISRSGVCFELVDEELTEFVSTCTITVTENPEAGDSLTISGGTGGNVVFTFVDHYPNNSSEIQIGADVNETAGNIATAINNITGAEFVATAADNIITVVANVSTPFSVATSSTGLTIGAITEIILGFNPEEASVTTEFTATEGGKSVQENASASDAVDGLIDGLSETVSATAVIDCLMDSMDENANASAASDNFDGLIDYMGDET